MSQGLQTKGPVSRTTTFVGNAGAYSFEMTDVTAAGVLRVNIAAGYVNGLLATGMDATTGLTITITVTTYFWLKLVGSFIGDPDIVTIETNTTGLTPAGTALTATSYTSFRLIGSVPVSGGAIGEPTQIIRSNRNVVSFGNLINWGPA